MSDVPEFIVHELSLIQEGRVRRIYVQELASDIHAAFGIPLPAAREMAQQEVRTLIRIEAHDA